MPLLQLDNVSVTYSKNTPFEKTAVENLSLTINRGELIGLIGHTGSGKSTMIQTLNGLIKPTSGRVLFNDIDIWSKGFGITNLRFKVGVVFQYPEYQLFEETVYKDIAYGPKNMQLNDDEIDERVRFACEFAGVDEAHLQKSPFELSGGQKRKVAIASIIAMKPDVLILDEPTAGLDPRGRSSMLRRITQYHKECGATVIFISHNMEDVAHLASRIVVLNQGRIALDGNAEQVFSHSEELHDMGLSTPYLTKVFRKLRDKGIDVNAGIYSVEQAKDEILRLMSDKKLR